MNERDWGRGGGSTWGWCPRPTPAVPWELGRDIRLQAHSEDGGDLRRTQELWRQPGSAPERNVLGLPWWSSCKDPPSSAEDMSSIPDQGTKIPHATGQLSPRTATREPKLDNYRAQAPQQERSPRVRQRRVHWPQWRLSTKNRSDTVTNFIETFKKWNALWALLWHQKQKQNKTSSCISSFPISSPIEFINTIIDLVPRISHAFHFHSSLSPFPVFTPVCTTESLIVTITLTSQLASPV